MPKTIDILLEEQNLSLSKLAERARLSLDRTDAIVNGRWTPSPDERTRLAAALGLPVDQIVWGHTMSPRNVRYRRCGLPEHLKGSESH